MQAECQIDNSLIIWYGVWIRYRLEEDIKWGKTNKVGC